jgi:hypothetical protein
MTKDEYAQMTLEITMTDGNQKGFALGGPREQARAMAAALAERLGVALLPDGFLRLTLPTAEVQPIMKWIAEQFPNVGWFPLDQRRPALMTVPPLSPWREFHLHVDDGIVVGTPLVTAVAMLVDGLYQYVVDWGLDPTEPIGAVAEDLNPVLRVTVEPAHRIVYVDHLPGGTELPPPMATPYSSKPAH